MEAMLESPRKLIRGKQVTRDEAVEENLGLVQKEANKWQSHAKKLGLEFGDLVSIGSIGLMKAFDSFDESLGFTFATYAWHKIRSEISREVTIKQSSDFKISVTAKFDALKIKKESLEKEPADVIAEKLGISKFRVESALLYLNQSETLRLDAQMENNKGEGSSLHDLIGQKDDLSNIIVEDFLNTLTSKEKEVIERILNGENASEVGRSIGKSRGYGPFHLKNIREKFGRYLEAAEKDIKRGVKKVAAVEGFKLTIEEYGDFKKQGFKDKAIAQKLGIDKQQLANWKYLRRDQLVKAGLASTKKQASVSIVKVFEPMVAPEVLPANVKQNEYAELINELSDALEEAKKREKHSDSIILELEEKLKGYEELQDEYKLLVKRTGQHEGSYKEEIGKLHAACEDVEDELEKVRHERDQLIEKNYQSSYTIENQKQSIMKKNKQLEKLEEENTALRKLVQLWI